MTTVIYNCKRCKTAKRVEYPIKGIREDYRKDENGKTYLPGIWIAAIGGGKPTEYAGDPIGICPNCGHMMQTGILKGRFNADIPCNAKCTGARGHSCECSCGGANHGSQWSGIHA